jgi:hypothetical protein
LPPWQGKSRRYWRRLSHFAPAIDAFLNARM